MPFLFLCGLLALISAEEKLDYSNVGTRIQIENHLKWFKPKGSEQISTRMDSSEVGVGATRSTSCKCGWSNRPAGRIIGGKQFRPHEYPFLVGISYGHQPYQPHCGGSILSSRLVLTAAHCTVDAKALFVTVGEHNRAERHNLPPLFKVERIIDHEAYHPVLFHNDISLLILEKRITFLPIIGPVCMPSVPGESLLGESVRIIGWGAESYGGPMTFLPQKVDVQVVDIPTCHKAWPYHVIPNPVTQICTHSAGKTPCQGDSGGPVVYLNKETKNYELAGLVSIGPLCTDYIPSAQTDIFAYRDWINDKIQKYAPKEVTCHIV
uniref:Venom S1 protease 35 n=1 Tax=Oncocephalus sp. TaxID=2944721 RepID=A0AB38ZES4_9HEMI